MTPGIARNPLVGALLLLIVAGCASAPDRPMETTPLAAESLAANPAEPVSTIEPVFQPAVAGAPQNADEVFDRLTEEAQRKRAASRAATQRSP